MKHYNSNSKRIWTTIGIILLVVLVVTLIFSLIPKKTDDGYKKVRTEWVIGSLTNGTYVDDHSVSLVSDYIEIKDGFKIEIDFDKDCSFAYVLYDSNKNPLQNGEINGPMSQNITVDEFDGAAKYMRVVICELDDSDDHISTFEKWEYSNYITIYTLEETEDE